MHPTILLINMEEEEKRPALNQNLEKNGYEVIVTRNEVGAINRVRDGRVYPPPSLILIYQTGDLIDPSLQVGKRVKQAANLPEITPIVAISDNNSNHADDAHRDVGEYEYIVYPESDRQIVDFLDQLCKPEGDRVTCGSH